MVLLLFPNANDLLKASFRSSIITMYGIGFALLITNHHNYSLQSILVAHSFVSILFLSAFALSCFRPILRTWRHLVGLLGTIPFDIWTFVLAVQSPSQQQSCYDVLRVQEWHIGETHTVPLYIGFWSLSGALFALSVPFLIWAAFPKICCARIHSKVVLPIAIVFWFIAWSSTVAYSEVAMASFSYQAPNGQAVRLQSTDLGFGQVMALVMLTSLLWDIGMYPLEGTPHGRRRFQNWWRNEFQPWRQRLFKGNSHLSPTEIQGREPGRKELGSGWRRLGLRVMWRRD
jgi:hypothetical protein